MVHFGICLHGVDETGAKVHPFYVLGIPKEGLKTEAYERVCNDGLVLIFLL